MLRCNVKHIRNYSHLASYLHKTGAQAIYHALITNNVHYVFGYTGGAILSVTDTLYKCKRIKYIKNVNEQCMGHAAEGYSKVANKPGIIISTSGPGVTNLITVMQNAISDGNPLIILSGQVNSSSIGTDAFQEAPSIELTRPCTKMSVQITDVNDIPGIMEEAFRVSMEGRKGPVFIDLPKDILSSTIHTINRSHIYTDNKNKQNKEHIDDANITELVQLLIRANKPIMYVGQGANNCYEYIRYLSKQLNIPVTTTIHGLGIMDERDDLSLHMLGMHGSVYANKAIQEADLILAIGSRFDDRTTGHLDKYAPAAKEASAKHRGGIVHFNIDEREINKLVQTDIHFTGDCKDHLYSLVAKINTNSHIKDTIYNNNTEWANTVIKSKKTHPFTYTPATNNNIKVQQVVEYINKYSSEAYITTGVGNHQMYMAQFYEWSKPSTMITSGSLGTMGFGLPSAIGVQLANNDSTVICFDGDGSFMMTANDLATIKEYNLPIKIFIMNDSRQQMVYIWQKLFFNERYISTDNFNPDFNTFADAFGIENIYCDDEDSLDAAVQLSLEYPGPIVVNCKVEPDMCTPLVAPGAALDDMIVENNISKDIIKITDAPC